MDTLDIKIKELEGKILFYRPSGYNSVYMLNFETGDNRGIIIVEDSTRFVGQKLSASFERDGMCKGVREVVKNYYKTKEDILLAVNEILSSGKVKCNRGALVQFLNDIMPTPTW